MSVLADLKNRGVRDIFFVVCGGLKGLPDSVNAVLPQTMVQACIIHLIPAHNGHVPVRLEAVLAAARDGPQADLHRPFGAAALEALDYLEEKWGKPYPAIPQLWRAAWVEFTPFPGYDVEIRTVLCSTTRSSRSTRPSFPSPLQ